MPSVFHGINLASSALRAFQRGLDITGHNIANVNTPGYSRQTLDLTQAYPIEFWSNGIRSVGQGVTMGSINRIRDLFLESRRQGTAADAAQYETLATTVKDILGAMQEPGKDGISASLGKFFDSWSALASNPNEAANRLQVQSAGKNLAGKVRDSWANLDMQETEARTVINETISQVNNIAASISQLNEQIRVQTSTGGEPNDLLDQRDTLVRQLSTMVNVQTRVNTDGTMSVNVSEQALVDQAGYVPLSTTIDAVAGKITGGQVDVSLRSGKLAGLIQSVQHIAAAKTQLDTLANNLRTQINAAHTTGLNQNNTTNIKFFNDSVNPLPQTGAIDFDLDPAVANDYKNISAGSTVPFTAGDGSLALSISQLRDMSIAGLSNRSFSQYQSDNINALGSTQSYFDNALSTQQAMLEQTDAQQEAVSGVNLDEEMANMLRFQRSYQAAAKALTIFDQVTEDLIGMLRR